MKKWLGKVFDALIAARETEAQRRVSHLIKHATDVADLDHKMRKAGLGGI